LMARHVVGIKIELLSLIAAFGPSNIGSTTQIEQVHNANC
jgi:hypothetical protein